MNDRKVSDLSIEEFENIVEMKANHAATTFATTKINDAIKKAMTDFLTGIGLDIANPLDLQQDFSFVRKQRKGSENLLNWGKKSIYLAAIGGALTWLGLGFKSWLKL